MEKDSIEEKNNDINNSQEKVISLYIYFILF